MKGSAAVAPMVVVFLCLISVLLLGFVVTFWSLESPAVGSQPLRGAAPAVAPAFNGQPDFVSTREPGRTRWM